MTASGTGFVLDANGNARGGVRTPADALAGTAKGFLRPADTVELITAAAKSGIP